MAEHNEIGKIGENITKTFLMKHGFSIIEANYCTKFGEIDIIARKDKKLHFIEVKSIKVRDVSFVENLTIKPEDNLTKDKWNKIAVSIDIYLKNRGVTHETKYQIDLACVYINTETREGKIRLLNNIYKE